MTGAYIPHSSKKKNSKILAISVNKNLGNIFKNFSNGVALKEKVGLGQNNSHGCTKERF